MGAKQLAQGAGVEEIHPQQLKAVPLFILEPAMELGHGIEGRLAGHQLHVKLLIQPASRGQPVVGFPCQLAAGGDEVGTGAVIEQLDGHHQRYSQYQPGQAHQQQPGVAAIEAQ